MSLSIFTRLFKRADSVDRPGSICFSVASGRALATDLSVIPSETSLAERIFLYFLAKEIVHRGNILELGPFLGGTTRALARGIEHSGIDGRRLVTLDQFDNYYDTATFKKFGVTRDGRSRKMVKFRSIFESFHRDQTYYPYIDARTLKIADSPDQSTDYSLLQDCNDIDAVFIDGCKSWYSAKDFVGYVATKTNPDAYFLFHDFGRYTCFWIPVFAESFPEHLKFVGSVDATFAYRLVKTLSKRDIDAVYSDHPRGMDEFAVQAIFDRVFERERTAGRPSGMVTARIQAAAFHAYLGDNAKARSMLVKLEQESFVRSNLKKRVQEALVTPTYSPDGPIRL